MTRNDDIERLRNALYAYVNDSCDQLIADDYDDARDDIERVERLMSCANIVHVLDAYEYNERRGTS